MSIYNLLTKLQRITRFCDNSKSETQSRDNLKSETSKIQSQYLTLVLNLTLALTPNPNATLIFRLGMAGTPDHQMSFLDVWIDNNDDKWKLNSYRKPTNTGRYINRQTLRKLNLIESLLHRAYGICNSYNLFHEHFQKIVSIPKSNDYSLWYVNKQIRLFFNKQHKSAESSISNCAADKNCDNLGALPQKKKFFFLYDFPISAK